MILSSAVPFPKLLQQAPALGLGTLMCCAGVPLFASPLDVAPRMWPVVLFSDFQSFLPPDALSNIHRDALGVLHFVPRVAVLERPLADSHLRFTVSLTTREFH